MMKTIPEEEVVEKMDAKENQLNLSPYSIPEYNDEDVIYQDEDGKWMVKPAHREGWIIEPHALYPQPDALKDNE